MLHVALLVLVAPLTLFSGSSSAQSACIDNDGDGWGWNGTASCRVGIQLENPVSSDPSGSACVDDDGDGWGWNGTASCRVGIQSENPVSSGSSGSACVDDDGDGWGWNGSTSCRVEAAVAPATTPTATGCVDNDGDGWGWGPSGSCRTSDDGGASSQQNADNSQTQSHLSNDLIAAHFDHGPDPDDGHAAAAAYVINAELNLNMVVVGGTYGAYSADRYLPQSEALMRNIWGQQWLDAHNSRAASAEQAARRWVSALSSNGDVWVAEGGPSDFTAAVVRILRAQYPEFNTRQRIHVVQHSQWNEDHALREDLQYVRANTHYIRIEDGNDPNSTADLRQDGASLMTAAFVQTARSSEYQQVWNHAFNYLSPNEKLDFSDTVELLYILDIGVDQVRDISDFGRYFLSQ